MASPARITIIVPELLPVPPTDGGAVEQWVHETSCRMDAKRYDIHICSRPTHARSPGGIHNIHVDWTAVERWFAKVKERASWRNPLRYVAKIVCVSSYGRRALRLAQGSEIIYIHNEPNLLLFLNKRPEQRVILHMHNDHLSSRLFRPMYRRLLNKVDTVVCVSDYIRQRALQHFPEHASKFKVLFNATDPGVFKPYGQEAYTELGSLAEPLIGHPVILYVGRLVPEKGVDVLIRAFCELKSQHPDARLVIVGSSFFAGAVTTPFQSHLKDLAERCKDDIVFTGYLPHAQIKYLYSLSDVTAFPSVWPEPFGLVMLEAMAAGTCLVASRAGGIPEVMENGRTGLLVEPADAHALAEALHIALSSPERRQQWGDAARAKICTEFTWQHLIHQLDVLLENKK